MGARERKLSGLLEVRNKLSAGVGRGEKGSHFEFAQFNPGPKSLLSRQLLPALIKLKKKLFLYPEEGFFFPFQAQSLKSEQNHYYHHPHPSRD